jgi:hypothetical protein
MKKLLITDSGADSLHPKSQTYEPQGHVAADAQGRRDDNFGYGGTAGLDGGYGDRTREPLQRVAPGADAQKRNDRSHWDDIQDSPQFNPLTKHILSQLSSGDKPTTGAERTGQDSGRGYETFAAAKAAAASQLIDRFRFEKGNLDGEGEPGEDTSASDKPKKVSPITQRNAY